MTLAAGKKQTSAAASVEASVEAFGASVEAFGASEAWALLQQMTCFEWRMLA